MSHVNPSLEKGITMSETQKRRRANKKSIITIKSIANPKRQGTLAHGRFELYKDGMTVAEYVAAGGRTGDVNHDAEAGYIELS
jgi:hypothetical protein